jgi:hypothetical protein
MISEYITIGIRRELLDKFVECANTKLFEYAEARRKDSQSGLETAHLGGLHVQKYALGMVDLVSIVERELDCRGSLVVEMDKATAVVDPNWRENMRKRFLALADVDLSKKRSTPGE